MFQEDDIIALLSDTQINLGKTPASCSAIRQPSDVSKCFMASKKSLKSLAQGFVNYKNHQLETDLKLVFRNSSSISTEKAKKFIDGLQKIVHTLCNVITKDIIVNGYAGCGQFPLNFDVAMKKCKYAFQSSDYDVLRAHIPDMIRCYRDKGYVEEREMDDMGIISVDNSSRIKVPKDQRSLHQQRAVMVNSADSLARFKQQLEKRQQTKLQQETRKANKRAKLQIPSDVAAAGSLEYPVQRVVARTRRRNNKAVVEVHDNSNNNNN